MKTPNEIKGKEKLTKNDKDQDYIPTEDCEDDEGPTMLFNIHVRKWEDHVAILFNEKNQPIRPTDDDVSEFSKFLGTMAHDHTWYDNDADRWKHHPNRVPEPHFKEISAKNFENREQQENMHTTGNTTNDSPPPSKRKMFEETRARKEGQTYKRPNGDTLYKIKRMKELESLQESGLDSDSDIDPVDKVMGKNERQGRLRLCGRGISSKDFNRNDKGSSPFVAPQLVDAIKSSLTTNMQSDLTAHKEKLENEYNAQ
ncbi:hypothetical protein Cgig2_012698 [Carnegiea gigantea]|uniref:Uncharacterized protein n=1 Tax=Carnegiea gigantea TaxID=171969 RepID=A0A9Q1Q907_9CARY|nr:hypothetical protein Cgig2_012698 [Carnegiea gigantea]